MNVTRDVVTDLLPVYFAGEASSDTKALVENFFTHDPEFARLAKAESAQIVLHDIPIPLTKEDEMKALDRTKGLLRRRHLFLNIAILFTGLAVSFKFDSDGIEWMWSNAPLEAIIFGIIGVLGWMGYLSMRWQPFRHTES